MTTGWPQPAREIALGFAYWLAFLLALEPGNVVSAHGLMWSAELTRIAGAATLGALATPLILTLVRLYPVEGSDWWQRAAVEAAAAMGIAAGLIVLSCVLAGWFLASEHRPLLTAVPEELTRNGPLLVFCIVGLLAIGHAFRREQRNGDDAVPASEDTSRFLTTVSARAHGRTTLVALDDVDWIEAQGNYLALHTGAEVHLIRETLAKFETQLDPACFIRIHRRTIVAADRVRAIEPLGQGDAQLTLKTGAALRLSRSYRDRLHRSICN